MKKFKVILTLCMAALLIIGTIGCSRSENFKSEAPRISSDKKADNSYDNDPGSSSGYAGASMKADAAPREQVAYSIVDNGGAIKNTSTVSSPVPNAGTMEKIIRRIDMEIETLEFDDLINAVNDEIKRLDGYVENSSINGKRYYDSGEMRRGRIIARIPKDKLDEFVGTVSDVSNVVMKLESTENVTLQYVDTESHIKTLELEQEKLYELLGKTGTLEDILTLESRLSSIRYELESYKSQLRLYDNKVDYSTVSLSIQEVERVTPTKEVKETVFTRIQTGFSDTMYNISEGFKDIVVGFAVNSPYILFWLFVILVAMILCIRTYRKYKRRRLTGTITDTQAMMKPDQQDGNQNHMQ